MFYTKAYWLNLIEAVVTTFGASFAAYLAATASTPSLHSIEVAAWAAGVQAIYQCSKAIGGTQVVATLKAFGSAPVAQTPPAEPPAPVA